MTSLKFIVACLFYSPPPSAWLSSPIFCTLFFSDTFLQRVQGLLFKYGNQKGYFNSLLRLQQDISMVCCGLTACASFWSICQWSLPNNLLLFNLSVPGHLQEEVSQLIQVHSLYFGKCYLLVHIEGYTSTPFARVSLFKNQFLTVNCWVCLAGKMEPWNIFVFTFKIGWRKEILYCCPFWCCMILDVFFTSLPKIKIKEKKEIKS